MWFKVENHVSEMFPLGKLNHTCPTDTKSGTQKSGLRWKFPSSLFQRASVETAADLQTIPNHREQEK